MPIVEGDGAIGEFEGAEFDGPGVQLFGGGTSRPGRMGGGRSGAETDGSRIGEQPERGAERVGVGRRGVDRPGRLEGGRPAGEGEGDPPGNLPRIHPEESIEAILSRLAPEQGSLSLAHFPVRHGGRQQGRDVLPRPFGDRRRQED